MVNQHYHTIFFQPIHYTGNVIAPAGSSLPLASVRQGVYTKVNEYFLRGIYYIQYILDLLKSSSPFFEQYGPVLEELPKMYKLVKAIKEINDEDGEYFAERNNYPSTFDGPKPKLFFS